MMQPEAGGGELGARLDRFGREGNLRAAVKALAAAELPPALREGLAELGALAEGLRAAKGRYDAMVREAMGAEQAEGERLWVLAGEALQWPEYKAWQEALGAFKAARKDVVERARLWVTGSEPEQAAPPEGGGMFAGAGAGV
jgi:hypothetical protein